MEQRYFEEYGSLEWIEPQDYYKDCWTYRCTLEADDGQQYDIVMHKKTMELRYTNI